MFNFSPSRKNKKILLSTASGRNLGDYGQLNPMSGSGDSILNSDRITVDDDNDVS